jgi:hypothetical protein
MTFETSFTWDISDMWPDSRVVIFASIRLATAGEGWADDAIISRENVSGRFAGRKGLGFAAAIYGDLRRASVCSREARSPVG